MKKIVHIIPQSGGVYDYSQIIGELYKGIDEVNYVQLAFDETVSFRAILAEIDKIHPDFVHFEVGGMQANFFYASRALRSKSMKQFVTIHDTGIIIARPSNWYLPAGRTPHLMALKLLRKIFDKTIRYTAIQSWLKDGHITFISLRKDSISGAVYLPQATYLDKPQVKKHRIDQVFTYAFAGYWSQSKGLDTLLSAFVKIDQAKHRKTLLKLYGGGFAGKDSFIDAIARRAGKYSNVNMPGLIPSNLLMETLGSLDVIVLPYWLNNPAGASAIAMRAAELGVPVVASRAPQLVEALGDFALYYEPDNSVEALHEALVEVRESYDIYKSKALKLQAIIFKERNHVVVQKRLETILKR